MAFFSSNSNDYISQIQSLTKPTYTSKYSSTISDLMDKITNREKFSYDFNADPLYQNYKDQYTKLGNEAAMNAAASVSTLTGGYGNSYASTAASQANQQYLTQLNSVIPELYNAALSKYQMETEDLYNQFDMYGTQEDRDYSQYRDSVSDYYNDYNNLYNGYNTAVSNEQWQKEYELSLANQAASASSSSGSSSKKSTSSASGSQAAYVAAYTTALKQANSGATKTDIAKTLANNTNLTTEQQNKIYADAYAASEKKKSSTTSLKTTNPKNKNQSTK